MRSITTTLAALLAALTLTAGAAMAQTMPADRLTKVTFSGPVSVPGMTLPAGTYTFRIADSDADRHIVQIFDKDSMKLYTTLLAIPAQRAEASGDPVITFKETPADRAPALRYWYYAGDTDGNEFVYPKAQAMAIAKASGEPVMAVESAGTSIDDMKHGTVSRVTPDNAAARPPAQPATPEPAPTQAPAAAPQQSAPAQPPAATPEQPTTAPSSPQRPVGTSGRLPKTASNVPLVGLIGLFALAGAVAVRIARTV